MVFGSNSRLNFFLRGGGRDGNGLLEVGADRPAKEDELALLIEIEEDRVGSPEEVLVEGGLLVAELDVAIVLLLNGEDLG